MKNILLITSLFISACCTQKHVTPTVLPESSHNYQPQKIVVTDTDTVYIHKTIDTRKKSLSTISEKINYTLGLHFAATLQSEGFELQPHLIAQAIIDSLTLQKTLLTPLQSDSVFAIYSNLKDSVAHQNHDKNILDFKKAGIDFLEKNKQTEGVVSLESGLQYTILKKGSGAKAAQSNKVTCHYIGHTITGTLFDSTYETDTPVTFPLQGAIPGWKEALTLMPVGSKWRLFIPSDLAYGARGAGSKIPPHAVLIVDLELLSAE